MIALAIALSSVLGLSPAAPAAPAPAPTSSEVATEPSPAVPVVEPARPKVKRRAAAGMVIGGAVVTAGFLGGSALLGAVLLDSGDPARQRMGRVLPIPFVGPFLAATRASGQRPGPFVALGVEQLLAASILTVGAVTLHRHRAIERDLGERRDLGTSAAVGMVTGGMMATMLTYGMTLGFARERARQGDPFARRLQIPLVGGFAAAARAPSHVRGFGALTSSTLQLGGVAVTTIGAVVLARKRTRGRPVAVVPFGDATGVHVSATWRF